MIAVKDLYKQYNGQYVLKGINLNAEDGLKVIYGGNGAGKSTLLKIMVGLERKDSGAVDIDGDIGYMPQDPLLYEEYRVSDYVHLSKSMGGKWEDLKELLKMLKIPERRSAWKLSYGMKKSLYLSVLLSANLDVYLLDEPFMGIDKNRREIFMDYMQENISEKTILLVESEEILTPNYVLEGGMLREV